MTPGQCVRDGSPNGARRAALRGSRPLGGLLCPLRGPQPDARGAGGTPALMQKSMAATPAVTSEPSVVVGAGGTGGKAPVRFTSESTGANAVVDRDNSDH